MRERPLLMATLLTAAGAAGSWVIIMYMDSWPVWMLFPAMFASVLALGATVLGSGLLVILLLEPVLGSKSFHWDADPIAALGLPLALQRKCEHLGFWTCESVAASIDKGRFPWTELEYDERMQVERSVSYWKAQAEDYQRAIS